MADQLLINTSKIFLSLITSFHHIILRVHPQTTEMEHDRGSYIEITVISSNELCLMLNITLHNQRVPLNTTINM